MYLTEVLMCISLVTSGRTPREHSRDSTLKASPGESEGAAGRGVGGQGLLPNQDLRLVSSSTQASQQFLCRL